MDRFELAQQLQQALFAHPQAGPIPVPASLITLVMEELRGLRAQPPESRPILSPLDADGKRPRLFYWEEAEDAWCPAETLKVENIIDHDHFIEDGEIIEVRFRRHDMTDAEFDALPEG